MSDIAKKELPYSARSAISDIERLCSDYEKTIESLKSQVAVLTNPEPPKKFLPYNQDSNPDFKYCWSSESVEKTYSKKYTVEQLKALSDEEKLIFDKNVLIGKENARKFLTIVKIFENFGLKKTKNVPVSRSRDKTKEVNCEWYDDLNKTFPSNPSFSYVESAYKNRIDTLQKYINDKAAKEKEEKLVIERENKRKEELALLISLNSKYNFGITVQDLDSNEILDKLLNKDKYLFLAHYLQKNRGDWTDGSHYAKLGISNFVCENDIDEEISEEIYGLINDWGHDGRYFRDCRWNYDVIFSLANKDLYSDYINLTKYAD